MDPDNQNRQPYNVDKRQPAVGIHRKNSKWWLIPLIILLVLLGLLGLYALSDEMNDQPQNSQSTNDAEEATPANTNTTNDQPISDINVLLASDVGDLNSSQMVELNNARVVQVINDRAFTVGNEGDYRFALLSGALDAGAAENQVQVRSGQTAEIGGTIVRVTEDTAQLRADYDLSNEQAQALAANGYYILVESIELSNS